ncbi:DUF4883 family protein [Clostridium botulinum]|uniref:Uncharacterized protein n=2 Tax=Clostridium botulinum TaxID=1491 RepID=A0A9Q1UYM6_CLOBO|nr:DUF4883 family protein [Clostridium botulinum]AEB75526.1 conserved protein [Clostridium botulinum BKT015925]KEH99602.1 hypothetical protein Z953_11475 [Clostridium botulinum D str. 16868]KEI03534.1 hypothetical protein Y848_04655 [Clostridium botulinum C/D str. Sp77]KLU74852.1 hypothetical protein CBC3_11865 [Clostridium botulinum V891]KOA73778.1 hypothetical protein ADU77_13460 [Clostridium botulinum]
MKKGSFIFIVLALIGSILISSKMYLNRKKPANFYYTNLLVKNLSLYDKYEVKILDTNFYKRQDISNEDIKIICSFFKELKKPNFITPSSSFNEKPKYKIFFSFPQSKEKYVINVYNSEYLSVQPWDGDFPMDYISTKNIPFRFSIYNLCKNAFFSKQNTLKP